MSLAPEDPGPPVIIFASREAGGSLLAALLGGHPAFYGAPHLNVLAFPEVWQYRMYSHIPRDSHMHGLLRFLGEQLVCEQTMQSLQAARRWLGRRDDLETPALYAELQALIAPRRLVDYSPLYAQNGAVMRRVIEQCPEATIIHLVCNPLTQGQALSRPVWQTMTASLGYWVDRPVNQPCMDAFEIGEQYIDWSVTPAVFDPQFAWYRTQAAALEVEAEQSGERWIRLSAEALLEDPKAVLRDLLRRLGAKADAKTVAAMTGAKEPPIYAAPGPYEAPFGIDHQMIGQSVRAALAKPVANDLIEPAAPLPWRGDGQEMLDDVLTLAGDLGYRIGGRA